MRLDAYLLEKAVYELGYELNNRPDWVWIPLQGIRQLWAMAQGERRAQHLLQRGSVLDRSCSQAEAYEVTR